MDATAAADAVAEGAETAPGYTSGGETGSRLPSATPAVGRLWPVAASCATLRAVARASSSHSVCTVLPTNRRAVSCACCTSPPTTPGAFPDTTRVREPRAFTTSRADCMPGRAAGATTKAASRDVPCTSARVKPGARAASAASCRRHWAPASTTDANRVSSLAWDRQGAADPARPPTTPPSLAACTPVRAAAIPCRWPTPSPGP